MQINKIKILSEDLANKIAAGEVIDRPASIVKELVENAIDAGSDEITVILKNGGKTLIQVADNGTGMTREDAILAIQRHTTSKIDTYDDLHNIKTLGFRGEALASIASVSRMELKTIPQKQSSGTLLKLEGGTVEDISDVGGTRGTSVTVKNLFYNTPARRKFLKSDETEYRYILNVMQRFTLPYFQISFTLYHNDQKIYDLKPATPEIRLVEVLGNRYREKYVRVEDKGTLLQIWGFIGNKDSAKKSRGDQFLFLNGRYIINRALNHAVTSSYGTIIPAGEFPMYSLFMEIDPRRIDVNVHPSKMEVKFADERLVYDLLRSSVRRSLSSQQIIPSLSKTSYSVEPRALTPSLDNVYPKQTAIPFYEITPSAERRIDFDTAPPQSSERLQSLSMPVREAKYERTSVWQVHNQYIVSQIKSGLIVIDQHVAHERILYEQALRNFERSKPASQQLLFPQVVDLTPEEFSHIMEILPFLEKIGFVIKGFGGNTIVLEGVPSGLKISKPDTIINDIIDEYNKNKNNSLDARDNVAKSYACKMAIKKGDSLTRDEMNLLIDQLFATQSPYFCPHGRPVIVTLSLDELDKRFGRS
ncbi:DNA mismatch repair endonuclease MutL [candidate division KSB1 bacterium]|nr:DNA mismatch repair endonuclease MutL [candidate division KSB1 bacterium]